MYRSQNTNIWFAFAAVVLLATLAQAAEHLQMLSGLRVAIQDVLSPGRLIVAALASPKTTSVKFASALPGQQQDGSRLEILEQQRRRLLIENARLNNQLRQHRMAQEASVRYRPLAEFDLVPARILSHSGMPTSLLPAMIDVGNAHGMTRSELVLDANGILLDQGVQDGIDSGRPVLTGSVVVGRIERCGRWVSQLVPVTDLSFSAPVRLVRRTPNGTHLGDEGMLEGTGTGCRIIGLPDTASVSVDDAVVSESIDGLIGPPLYYGTVAEATFQSAGEWSVRVVPAIDMEDLDRVVVVVPKLNNSRIAPTAQGTLQ
jgi:cell shape-determining protein MreC